MPEVNKKLEIRKQRAFEYLVLLHPTIEEAEKGASSEIIVQPKLCCADNEEQAHMLASREIPQDKLSQLARIEVATRPF